MTWEPISLEDLRVLLAEELDDCPLELRDFFARVGFPPVKWRQSPWGHEGGGFWAVATHEDRVLWYNDIEAGFNVSHFAARGTIPDDQYWCNQDPLKWAIPRLQGQPGTALGPPRPLGSDE